LYFLYIEDNHRFSSRRRSAFLDLLKRKSRICKKEYEATYLFRFRGGRVSLLKSLRDFIDDFFCTRDCSFCLFVCLFFCLL